MLEQLAGRPVQERELGTAPLSEEELDKLIGKRDHVLFLNSRNALFRERKMKERPPDREEALKQMAGEPNLIKRPLLLHGGDIVYGFDEQAYRDLLRKG